MKVNPTYHHIIKKPLVTEKVSGLTASANQYGFMVHKDATRTEVKNAVESLFKVKVKRVRTMIVRGKIKSFRQFSGKRPNWKKAYVTLGEGQKIELFPGV